MKEWSQTHEARNLIVLWGPEELVAVESKCLEYLTLKRAKFSEHYGTEIVDERTGGPWFAEMKRLVKPGAAGYRWLDAAQLIKHAFGLAFHPTRPVTLFYLFWEPMDAGLSPLFAEHRRDIDAFAEQVAGGTPKFEALSYPELWERWANSGNPRLAAHVAALRARYEVGAWAWNMVEWKNGRAGDGKWTSTWDRQEPDEGSLMDQATSPPDQPVANLRN